MAREIWKYQLGNGSPQDIEMPMHAEPITVQQQHGLACIWAMVEPGNVKTPRRIHIVGTGSPMPEGPLGYIGTIQQGLFVWHVFEEYLG